MSLTMQDIKEGRYRYQYISSKDIEAAKEYVRTQPPGWITVLGSCKAFWYGEVRLMEDAKLIGPAIAKVLKDDYDIDATYYEATNCIHVRSNTRD
jgi:hypothetical protein